MGALTVLLLLGQTAFHNVAPPAAALPAAALHAAAPPVVAVAGKARMSAPAPAEGMDPVARWCPYIHEASRRFGVPRAWIERVMRAESGGRTTLNGRPITSRAGAMGLMQLMPGTWSELRRQLRLGADPHDPRDNILAGTAYLRRMYDRFGYPGLFAAYNAGPGRYAAHLARGRPLPAETRAYLAAVAGAEMETRSGPAEPPANHIFFTRFAPGTSLPAHRAAPRGADRLFAIRRDAPGGHD